MRKLLLLAQITLVGSAAVHMMAADLPIREVILYKHGVGYFERSGELRAGETARLDFKASDMNDVLKSLTIVDRNGGVIGGVRYDARRRWTSVCRTSRSRSTGRHRWQPSWTR